jgi:ankyrin repeat protein
MVSVALRGSYTVLLKAIRIRMPPKSVMRRVVKAAALAQSSYSLPALYKALGEDLPQDDLNMALKEAQSRGRKENVKFLLKKGANPSKRRDDISQAIRTGFTEYMVALLESGEEPSQYLADALKDDPKNEIVELLLNCGAHADDESIFAAIEEAPEYLPRLGLTREGEEMPAAAVNHAVSNLREDALRAVLALKAPILKEDLQVAVNRGRADMVQILLDHGAEVGSVDTSEAGQDVKDLILAQYPTVWDFLDDD